MLFTSLTVHIFGVTIRKACVEEVTLSTVISACKLSAEQNQATEAPVKW